MTFFPTRILPVALILVLAYLIARMSQTPAAPLSGAAYSEAEIVDLVSALYHTLLRQGHLEDGDVIWPPEAGHDIDVSALLAPIDPRVISLMRRLPTMERGNFKDVAVAMRPVDYRDREELVWSRDIDKQNAYANDAYNARPTDLLLLVGSDPKDPSLVFDVSENTIRYFGDDLDDETNQTLDHDAAMQRSMHYRNWPAEHGPAYLRRLVQKVHDADVITNFDGALLPANDDYPPMIALRQLLRDQYLWPGQNFRRDEWLRDGPDAVAQVMEGEDDAFDQEYERRLQEEEDAGT